MTSKNLRNVFSITFILYVVFAVLFYLLSSQQLHYRVSRGNIEMPDADTVTEEITSGKVISQDIDCNIEIVEDMAFVFTKFYRDADGVMVIFLYDGNKELARRVIRLEDVPEQSRVYMNFEEPLRGMKGKTITIRIYSTAKVGHGVAAMMRSQWPGMIAVGSNEIDGSLCFTMSGIDENKIGHYYWHFVLAFGLFLAALFITSYRGFNRGHYNYLIIAIGALYQYEFLISQLVIRDFKSKYKRSILGIFWSFLNPLLTMTVQFLVFSTFFRANTQNYPIYLLSGVVCFSFFNECTTMCLTSISGNARLITKVYIPKYIFPLARTISSSINLGISLVPLLLACLVLGVALKPQAILFFYFLACLIVFSLGIGLFLSALMVFFRDIQFLWTVLTQIWMYATPIFYPAEIIPEKYRFIVRFNPLYHFIGNARTCLINGVSPEPRAYIFCFLFAALSILIGAYTFKKTQDRFALYL